MKTTQPSAFRASILHFLEDPLTHADAAFEYFDDGLLVVDEGHVVELGNTEEVLSRLDHPANMIDCQGHLLIPGFIDAHMHYPQVDVMASYGEHLMGWLSHHTFPCEAKFKDPRVAMEAADFFLTELLRNGTTSASVFCTSHKVSAEAFFETASQFSMRMIAGQVMMDQHAPQALCQDLKEAEADCLELIRKWHNTNRLQYAITPRFAVTSSESLLRLAGEIVAAHPDTYIQTHLAENQEEIALVQKIFPKSKHYLDVYQGFGLVQDRSLFAHGIHLSESELDALQAAEARIVFCPSSNLFLGSGLLNLDKLLDKNIHLAIGSDIGAGNSFSMFKTLQDAYKVCQLTNSPFDPIRGFYQATLGNARSLHLEQHIGSFQAGKEADFILIDESATPLQARKHALDASLAERLFSLMMLADERSIKATYIKGKLAHDRDA